MSRSRGIITSIQSVCYHRNGVAGAGFYSVAFTVRNGRQRDPMIGIVFAPDTDTTLTDGRDVHGHVRLRFGESVHKIAYAVLNPAYPTARYRGDEFFPQMAEAIDEWTADGRAFSGSEL